MLQCIKQCNNLIRVGVIIKTIKMNRINLLLLVLSLLAISQLSESCKKDDSLDDAQIQTLLDGGTTPKTLYDDGVTLDQLYGKTYAGGLIFHLNTDDGTGMVAAMEDYSTTTYWGCVGTDIMDLANLTSLPASDAETEVGARIGDGKVNTDAILAGCITNDGIAAKLCRDLGEEWFLPSRGELYLMYTNLHEKGHSVFAAYDYWSSTEYDSENAWVVYFDGGGGRRSYFKSNSGRVRAVRAF
jgi:hypothetical protein